MATMRLPTELRLRTLERRRVECSGHWIIRERDSGEEEVVPHGSPGKLATRPC